MIFSETIEIIYSNVVNSQTFSDEEKDYRVVDEKLRLTEDSENRITELEDYRLLES